MAVDTKLRNLAFDHLAETNAALEDANRLATEAAGISVSEIALRRVKQAEAVIKIAAEEVARTAAALELLIICERAERAGPSDDMEKLLKVLEFPKSTEPKPS